MKEKLTIQDLLVRLLPYKELIKFVAVFLTIHFLWKWAVSASEDDAHVYFFASEITKPFLWISNHLAIVTRYLIESLFGTPTYLYENQIYFEKSLGICVVWSCSGVKQYLIGIAVILFAKGSWKQKLWFVPVVIIGVYLLNMIRLVGVGVVTINHMEWFDFFHKIIFRGILYGGIFGMWWWFTVLESKKRI